jgi:hypothetical protein
MKQQNASQSWGDLNRQRRKHKENRCIWRKSSNRLSEDKVSLRCDCGSVEDLAEVGSSNVRFAAVVVVWQQVSRVIRCVPTCIVSGYPVVAAHSS